MIAGVDLGLRAARSGRGLLVGGLAAAAAACLTLLLGMAAALPSALDAPDARAAGRYPVEQAEASLRPFAGGRSLPGAQRSTMWRGRRIEVIEVAGTGAAPPGVARLPARGQSVVSPALAELLDRAGAELAPRVPPAVGRIAPAGLQWPSELFAYVGVAADEVVRDPDRVVVRGWGLRSRLTGDRVSPLVSTPLTLVLLLPSAALLSALLRLDLVRRQRRAGVLQLLGAPRRAVAAADLAFLGPWLALGWAAALVLRGPVADVVARRVLGSRLFFAADIEGRSGTLVLVLAVLLAVVVAVAVRDAEEGDVVDRAEGAPARVRRAGRTVLFGVALAGGLAGSALSIASGPESSMRTAEWLLTSAGLVVTGVLGLSIPATRAVASGLGGRGLAAELAAARLAVPRGRWRSAAASLVIAGLVLGVGLAVITALDATTETDQVIWHPERVPDGTAFAVVPRPLVPSVADRPGDAVALWLEDASVEGGGTSARREVVVLSCGDVDRVIHVAGGAPCGRVFALLPDIHPASLDVRDGAGALLASGPVIAASSSAPSAVVAGTEDPIVTVPAAELARLTALPESRAGLTYAVLTPRRPVEVEAVRNVLWRARTLAINGGEDGLDSVVTKADLLQDGSRFARRMTALLVAVTIGGLATALAAMAVSSAAEVVEQRSRDATLELLGARPGLVGRAHAAVALVPGVVAGVSGTLLGGTLGVLYLSLADYPQLDGALRGFPALRFVAVMGGLVVGAALVVLGAVRIGLALHDEPWTT